MMSSDRLGDDDVDRRFEALAADLNAAPDLVPLRPGSLLPGYRVRPHEDHGVAGSLVDQLAALPRRHRGRPTVAAWLLTLLVVAGAGAVVVAAMNPSVALPWLVVAVAAVVVGCLLKVILSPKGLARQLRTQIAAETRLAAAVAKIPSGELLPLWDRVLPGSEHRVALIAVTSAGVLLVEVAAGGPWKQDVARGWHTKAGAELAPRLLTQEDAIEQVLLAVRQAPAFAHPRLSGRQIRVVGWVVESAPLRQRLLRSIGACRVPPLPPVVGRVDHGVRVSQVHDFGDVLRHTQRVTLSTEEVTILHHVLDQLAPPAPLPH